MVGASELPFRLLCRKYGATTAYTPMISSARFAIDAEYREQEFKTAPGDRPLVAHFSCNKPEELIASVKFVEDRCDAIDLNLGCPQRTAFLGHFGSYLLGDEDRELVLRIVKETSAAITLPLFVKIRLLNSVKETIAFVKQLRDNGAALVAIHARYRASFERTGAGARDGAAMLDQVDLVKKALGDFPIVANGNVITFDDVEKNLEETNADGIMSAEGILDDPAVFVNGLPDSNPEKQHLIEFSKDKINLALEYLELSRQYPVPTRCAVFHVRRMCKAELMQYQLMEECVASPDVAHLQTVVDKLVTYRSNPEQFQYDVNKAKQQKIALENKKLEEGKRKRYEDRLTRKAKREGLPLDFYLKIGAEAPSVETIEMLKALSKEQQLAMWKEAHSQHCLGFHLNKGGCKRDRSCAFIHMDVGANTFEEKDEIAG